MENFVYTKGRNEIVTFRRDFRGDSCQVFLDGQECESCTYNKCTDGRNQNPSFSCTNLEADAVYDFCDDPLIIPDGSVFEPWANGFGFFELPYNGICHLPTEAPTDLPTEAPSSTPVGVVITVTSLIVLLFVVGIGGYFYWKRQQKTGWDRIPTTDIGSYSNGYLELVDIFDNEDDATEPPKH